MSSVHVVDGVSDLRVGPCVLSLVREDRVRKPTVFHVLVHHDDDGYIFSETFERLDAAMKRFDEKSAELTSRPERVRSRAAATCGVSEAMASAFTIHEIEGFDDLRVGQQVLSLVREDHLDSSPSVFHVLVHHDDDGYVFSKTFSDLDSAVRSFRDKKAELLKAAKEASADSS